MLLDQVKEVISKKFHVGVETLTPETRLREDVHIDSLDSVELLMELEDTFGIKIDDVDAASLTTIGSIDSYVTSKVKKTK